ncbi:MAG: LacI family DNA-binding transcriptional regulator [Christensenellales bacterium]
MKKKVTMKDIARELGVSTVTVSKALTDKEGVSEEVRTQIKLLSKKMGYLYIPSKNGVNSRETNIGIVMADRFFSNNAFYSNLYKTVVLKAADAGFSGILEIVSEQAERELTLPQVIAQNKADGIIFLGQMDKAYINLIVGAGLPYVFLDFYDEHADVSAVVSDSVYGTYQLTNYLLEQGHTRVGFIGNITSTSSILDRYLGYCRSLLEHGVPMRGDWLISDRDERGRFIDIAMPDDMPSAFVCNCDEVAYQLMEKLKTQGYSLPADISLVGFDDHVYAKLCIPQLTTYRVDVEAMGAAAVSTIIRKINKKYCIPGRIVVGGEFVIRDSVARIAPSAV